MKFTFRKYINDFEIIQAIIETLWTKYYFYVSIIENIFDNNR